MKYYKISLQSLINKVLSDVFMEMKNNDSEFVNGEINYNISELDYILPTSAKTNRKYNVRLSVHEKEGELQIMLGEENIGMIPIQNNKERMKGTFRKIILEHLK